MDEYGMLENIKVHSFVVARVAELLTRNLQAAGIVDLPLDTIIAGALLHDIGKTECLDNDKDHARVGKEICLQLGFSEIAEIVGQHVILRNDLSRNCCTPIEVVYYADKRVLHDEVVGLEARLDYILARYGRGDARLHRRIRENFDICKTLEQKMFSHFDIEPEAVQEMINGSNSMIEFRVPLWSMS